jgi:CRP-like cAMP-binding protein
MFGVFGDLSGFLPDNGAPGGNSSGAGGAAPNSARRAMQRSVPDLTTLGAGSARRKTVVGQGLDPEAARRYVAPVHEKSEADIGMIVQLLSENVLFSFLATKELRTIALAMVRAVFPYNADLMVQGGPNDALYVLQSGSCNILKDGQVVFTKTPGTGVGELELMYEAPCAATVRVATDEGCVAWRLDRDTYRNLVMGSALRRREEYTAHLENVPFLSTLSRYEKLQIADALSTDEWQAGDYLIKMDEPGEWMFIILEGTVEVVGREHGVPKPICQFEAGHFIGELEFLNNHRTVADVIAKSATVRTAKLNRRHFEMCLGPVKDVLRRNTEHPKYEYYRKILEQQGGSPAKQH